MMLHLVFLMSFLSVMVMSSHRLNFISWYLFVYLYVGAYMIYYISDFCLFYFLTEDFICSFAPWYRNKIVTVLGLRSLICGAKKFPRTLVTRLTLLVDSYLNLLSGVTWIMQHRDSFGVSNFICWINEAVIEERWTVFRTYNCI